ncbi:mechanosensitive ion channel family protein [Stieleria marina]|uniref:mechanosensitive ion channel family protein n=1 Tax=Stieleria marina TaxID=1930275 RepID=UPI003AF3B701
MATELTALADETDIDGAIDKVHQTAVESVQSITNGDFSIFIGLAKNYVLPGAIALAVLFFGYLFAKYLSRIASRPVCRRVDETLGKFLDRVIFYAVMLGVTALVMNQIGIKMSGAAAVVAAMGFAIGLAFQGTLSNFAAGILLMVFRPFKVGDVVNAAGVVGKVDEIDLFTTVLDTPDNRRIIVPNSSISGGTIENVSFHSHRRVEVMVGVDYTADLKTTRAALQSALDMFAAQTIQGDKRGGQVILSNLGDSAVEWKVRMWVASADYWPLHESLVGEVKERLDSYGIGIPFPQLDVHISQNDSGEAADSPSRKRPRVRTAAQNYPHAA